MKAFLPPATPHFPCQLKEEMRTPRIKAPPFWKKKTFVASTNMSNLEAPLVHVTAKFQADETIFTPLPPLFPRQLTERSRK